jgi:ubiquinone/menaquinone biosynthesis C-methylase UbiE
MTTNRSNDPARQYSSTYAVDRSNQDEMTRLTVQDQMITEAMGGPLPEQPNAASFKRILDIGCGTGGWLIEAAKTYPNVMQLVGIDVNNKMIEYARRQAQEAGVSDRVEFHVMDALLALEFPKDYFDLVNARFITSFMRTWNWPKLLNEMQRIARPDAIIRITEIARVSTSTSSPMLMSKAMGDALYNSGHLFKPGKADEFSSEGTVGVADELPRLMSQYGVQNVQVSRSTLEFRQGTPGGDSFAEDLRLGFRTAAPFIRKWAQLPENYEELYKQAVNETQQPGFVASWDLVTVWGTRQPPKTESDL